jgi:hypothetical protein
MGRYQTKTYHTTDIRSNYVPYRRMLPRTTNYKSLVINTLTISPTIPIVYIMYMQLEVAPTYRSY